MSQTEVEKAPASFDYNALEKGQRAYLRSQETAIKAAFKRTQNDIIEIGQRLIDVKEHVGHGVFTQWVSGVFGMHERHARRFMNVAEAFGKTDNLSDLSIQSSALYALAAPSVDDETRQVAVELAESGEVITHAAAKDLIDAAKPTFNGNGHAAPAPNPPKKAPAPPENVDGYGRPLNGSAPPPDNDLPPEPEVPEPGSDAALMALPLYQALTNYGHKGVIFLNQAKIWHENAALIRKCRGAYNGAIYQKGPVTSALETLAKIPEPAQWMGCPACKGSGRVGERKDPCERCRGGFTIHPEEGVSADVVAAAAG